jgi:microcystin degradation protein MlrC
MGAKILVVSDAAPEKGAAIAEKLGRELFSMRGRAHAPTVSLEAAIERIRGAKHAPILLADISDNPDCGAPGDATYVAHALLAARIGNFAWGALWDPLAVKFAREAGVGACVTMRIGGRACALSGPPLDLDVRVKAFNEMATQSTTSGPMRMGSTAALEFGDIDIVVTDRKRQTFGPDIFTDLGIELSSKRVIVVKSAQHYRTLFLPYFAEDIALDAPGVCRSDIRSMPLKRIPRPMWPFDDDPFADAPGGP